MSAKTKRRASSGAKGLAGRFFDLLSSVGFSCVLLILLGLLTWLGTLEQVEFGLYEVQRKYFESFVLVHDWNGIPIPLPGANLVMCLLFVNLVLGGMVRMRRDGSTVGILVTHVGIALLLLSGFVKLYHSQDGHVTLFETQRANWFQSYVRWEVAVARRLPDGSLEEHLIPEEHFSQADGSEPARFASEALPFALELSHVTPNCVPLPKGPMFEVDVPVIDGVFLKAEPRKPEAEANVAGAYARLVPKDGGPSRTGILWGLDRGPWTVEAGGEVWAVDLRRERYPMPFTLVLDDFRKEDHPRLSMARSFESDVTVLEHGAERAVEISMNEPLRDQGLVLYQASWGPSNARPGDPLFSTFSVVRNPADRWPLIACIITALGLVVHFTRKLSRYIRVEARRS